MNVRVGNSGNATIASQGGEADATGWRRGKLSRRSHVTNLKRIFSTRVRVCVRACVRVVRCWQLQITIQGSIVRDVQMLPKMHDSN